MKFEKLNENIFCWTISHKFIGLHLGARMTALRTQQGVLLHSPIPLSSEVQRQVAKLGEVTALIAPNLMHHLYFKEAMGQYPEASTWIAPGLEKKRPDLATCGSLERFNSPGIQKIPIEGCAALGETVFYYVESKCLIGTDFLHHFPKHPHWPTRLYSKLMGFSSAAGVSRLIRPTFRDRKATRKSIDRILELDIECIVPAHGEIIRSQCREVIETGYAWL